MDTYRRGVGQVFSDGLPEPGNLLLRIFRVFDFEFVAQANPDIGITAVPGGDVFQVGRRVAAVIAGPQYRA